MDGEEVTVKKQKKKESRKYTDMEIPKDYFKIRRLLWNRKIRPHTNDV